MKQVGKHKALLAAVLLAAIVLSGGCLGDKKEGSDGAAAGKAAAPSAPVTAPITSEKEPASAKPKAPAVSYPEPSVPEKRASAAEPEKAKQQETASEGLPAAGYPYVPPAATKPSSPESGVERAVKGRLAIVIDDFGYRSPAKARILALDYPITCAVLPDGKTTAEDGRAAHDAGKLVILHMPMEAQDYTKSDGEGFIRVGMEPGEVRARLHVALQSVPMAKGVSNHMGSLVSKDEAVLEAFIEEVDYLGLFYLDSRTATDTLGPQVARRLGAEAYLNSTFLDGVDDEAYVEERLWLAAEKAKAEGQAVAIGHVRLSTAKALEKVLPQLEGSGIELVFVNQLDPL
ncbi:MAG: divergent polysaccharide deacetylase family protein [Firmicutes bacterium]|nr:divergent polysaccharide deacetylase family protein [Bacillota bacterium]